MAERDETREAAVRALADSLIGTRTTMSAIALAHYMVNSLDHHPEAAAKIAAYLASTTSTAGEGPSYRTPIANVIADVRSAIRGPSQAVERVATTGLRSEVWAVIATMGRDTLKLRDDLIAKGWDVEPMPFEAEVRAALAADSEGDS